MLEDGLIVDLLDDEHTARVLGPVQPLPTGVRNRPANQKGHTMLLSLAGRKCRGSIFIL